VSGFTDRMIDDGFTDPQSYMDYLEDEAMNNCDNQMSIEDDYFETDDFDYDDENEY
jgi:hypothetical protein